MAVEAVRLQKWLAEAGLCSRREGEEWILHGRVTVNGVVVKELGNKVSRGDQVLVDGRLAVPLQEPVRVVMLHKPAGVVCTRKDPENRRSVFELLPAEQARMISIGRLDYNSEGLLLFTNHGELAHQLMHPSTQIPRTYRVRVHGRIDAAMLARLQEGVLLEDGPTGPLSLTVDQVPGANSWLTITLNEGRNRIVRRIFAAVDMEVSRLLRTQYGTCELADLPRGEWRLLTMPEIKALLSTYKIKVGNLPEGRARSASASTSSSAEAKGAPAARSQSRGQPARTENSTFGQSSRSGEGRDGGRSYSGTGERVERTSNSRTGFQSSRSGEGRDGGRSYSGAGERTERASSSRSGFQSSRSGEGRSGGGSYSGAGERTERASSSRTGFQSSRSGEGRSGGGSYSGAGERTERASSSRTGFQS
ncbi:pseudouridine synthase, partial [Candidatus Magnetaquicoccus inordinatus]|uniref:pseudouridine synthase n=1 Tax=Candidatus Magnetaquicoccus inordinatus TaxID=2496818 RepID=UPI00102AA79A